MRSRYSTRSVPRSSQNCARKLPCPSTDDTPPKIEVNVWHKISPTCNTAANRFLSSRNSGLLDYDRQPLKVNRLSCEVASRLVIRQSPCTEACRAGTATPCCAPSPRVFTSRPLDTNVARRTLGHGDPSHRHEASAGTGSRSAHYLVY